MTKFNVSISETVCRALAQPGAKTASRVKAALAELTTDPFTPRSRADIKKLHGFEKPFMYRLRIGDFRAIYFVTDSDVKVTELMLRSKGYEWLD